MWWEDFFGWYLWESGWYKDGNLGGYRRFWAQWNGQENLEAWGYRRRIKRIFVRFDGFEWECEIAWWGFLKKGFFQRWFFLFRYRCDERLWKMIYQRGDYPIKMRINKEELFTNMGRLKESSSYCLWRFWTSWKNFSMFCE